MRDGGSHLSYSRVQPSLEVDRRGGGTVRCVVLVHQPCLEVDRQGGGTRGSYKPWLEVYSQGDATEVCRAGVSWNPFIGHGIGIVRNKGTCCFGGN